MSRSRPWAKMTEVQREAAVCPLLQDHAVSTIAWKLKAPIREIGAIAARIRRSEESADAQEECIEVEASVVVTGFEDDHPTLELSTEPDFQDEVPEPEPAHEIPALPDEAVSAPAAKARRPVVYSETWSPERCKKLSELIHQGYSASQIAAEIGCVSRNAVVGRAHRMGLRIGRSTKVLGKKEREPSDRPAPPAAPSAKPQPEGPSLKAQHPRKIVPFNITNKRRAARATEPDTPVQHIERDRAFHPIPGTTPIGLMKLTQRTCRRMVNGLHGREDLFCGEPTRDDGCSWCAAHARLAFSHEPLKRLSA